jgi:hypothetical protein
MSIDISQKYFLTIKNILHSTLRATPRNQQCSSPEHALIFGLYILSPTKNCASVMRIQANCPQDNFAWCSFTPARKLLHFVIHLTLDLISLLRIPSTFSGHCTTWRSILRGTKWQLLLVLPIRVLVSSVGFTTLKRHDRVSLLERLWLL